MSWWYWLPLQQVNYNECTSIFNNGNILYLFRIQRIYQVQIFTSLHYIFYMYRLHWHPRVTHVTAIFIAILSFLWFFAICNQTPCLLWHKNSLPVHVGLDRLFCICAYILIHKKRNIWGFFLKRQLMYLLTWTLQSMETVPMAFFNMMSPVTNSSTQPEQHGLRLW